MASCSVLLIGTQEDRIRTSRDHFVSKNATPTIVNSMGMNHRRKWYAILRGGHSGLRKSLYDRGESTRVSQAATVKVHTKKYLWAERWGGRLREGGRIEAGSSPDIAGSVVPVLERVKWG